MSSRARLLLGDDHPMIIEGLTHILGPRYDLVGVATDGHHLLASARALCPDVVVTDITMPRLSGFEVLGELRRSHPEIRVVMLSMHDEPEYARRAVALGASGFVAKDARPDCIIDAIEAALAGQIYVGPGSTAPEQPRPMGAGVTSPLSPRQQTVLRLIGRGLSVKGIAAELGISPRTVEYHKYQIMDQLSIRSSPELIRYALEQGELASSDLT
jgi:DNA-binding NarL/FixJ family response regulator